MRFDAGPGRISVQFVEHDLQQPCFGPLPHFRVRGQNDHLPVGFDGYPLGNDAGRAVLKVFLLHFSPIKGLYEHPDSGRADDEPTAQQGA